MKNIPLKKVEVLRLLAIDDLPLDVKKGIEIIIDILKRIGDMLDYNAQNSLFMLLSDLPIDMEIHDVNTDEYNRFDGYNYTCRMGGADIRRQQCQQHI